MNRTDENTEKAFEADPAQLEPAIEPTAASNGTPPPATEASANELTPGQHAFAPRQAEAVIASEGTADGNGDGDFTSTFASAPPVPGEFRLPLSKLAEWVYHPRAGSREKGEHFYALALTAAEPDDLRPLVVLDEVDVVDLVGRSFPQAQPRRTNNPPNADHVARQRVQSACAKRSRGEAPPPTCRRQYAAAS
mgnify:CR=1 FL=1